MSFVEFGAFHRIVAADEQWAYEPTLMYRNREILLDHCYFRRICCLFSIRLVERYKCLYDVCACMCLKACSVILEKLLAYSWLLLWRDIVLAGGRADGRSQLRVVHLRVKHLMADVHRGSRYESKPHLDVVVAKMQQNER